MGEGLRRLLGGPKVHFALFLFLSLFLVVQVSWWVFFQVRAGEEYSRVQHKVWEEQIMTSYRWAAATGASEQELRRWLEDHFPDLMVLGEGPVVGVSPSAHRQLDEQTSSTVRMFAWEGAFFTLVLLAGMVFMYWTLRREIAVERRQANFLAAITHELKTPITAVRLYLDTLRRRSLGEEQRSELLGSMHEEMQRLQNLIDRLLHARQMMDEGGSGRGEVVELGEETARALDQVLASLKMAHGDIHIELDRSEELPVRMDPDQWQLVVSNLVENAVKYSRGEGKVSVELERSGRRALLRVRDEGAGFRRSEARRIFGRFYRIGSEDTRRSRGSGLGLYLVREIVRANRGRVLASSPGEGRGATFTVALPLAKEKRDG